MNLKSLRKDNAQLSPSLFKSYHVWPVFVPHPQVRPFGPVNIFVSCCSSVSSITWPMSCRNIRLTGFLADRPVLWLVCWWLAALITSQLSGYKPEAAVVVRQTDAFTRSSRLWSEYEYTVLADGGMQAHREIEQSLLTNKDCWARPNQQKGLNKSSLLFALSIHPKKRKKNRYLWELSAI